MEKTKLGISISLMGAIMYLTALCGGFMATLLLCGYILLIESDKWLKFIALKSVLLALAFSAAYYVADLIPYAINLIDSFVGIFNGHFYIDFINDLKNLIYNALSLAKPIVFLISAVLAMIKGNFAVPFIDDSAKKNLG